MAQMSVKEVTFFLDRFSVFYNNHELSKKMGVTYSTFLRWVEGLTTPSEKHRPKFHELYDSMLDELQDTNDFTRQIADLLIAEGLPKATNSTALLKTSRNTLRDLIQRELGHGRSIRSTSIFKKALPLGFDRIAVHREAKKMGVIKQQVGQGRNSYSVWRLP